jgi:phosphate transport system substrate-binding protein
MRTSGARGTPGTGGPSCLSWLLLCLFTFGPLPPAAGGSGELRGVMIVAGHGPERPVIDTLARAFERAHPGTAVDVKWNRNFRTAWMVKSGKADLAVTGTDDPGLAATTVAWDGIAVIVNFSNPVNEVTSGQLRDLFSGKTLSWFDLNERASETVEVIRRPDHRNVTAGFEESLGIMGGMSKSALILRADQTVLRRVSGRLGAIGYLSLGAALEAVKFGTPVRILIVDGVEPGEPTVRNGRYKLRRPVLFLAGKRPQLLRDAFVAFALSPAGQRIIGRQYYRLAH